MGLGNMHIPKKVCRILLSTAVNQFLGIEGTFG
jgi:hypothetical protein